MVMSREMVGRRVQLLCVAAVVRCCVATVAEQQRSCTCYRTSRIVRQLHYARIAHGRTPVTSVREPMDLLLHSKKFVAARREPVTLTVGGLSETYTVRYSTTVRYRGTS